MLTSKLVHKLAILSRIVENCKLELNFHTSDFYTSYSCRLCRDEYFQKSYQRAGCRLRSLDAWLTVCNGGKDALRSWDGGQEYLIACRSSAMGSIAPMRFGIFNKKFVSLHYFSKIRLDTVNLVQLGCVLP